MASITSAGLGSGLDVNGILKQLMAVESQPLTALDRKESVYQAKLSAYGSLKGAVSSFQVAMRGLSSLSKFQVIKATSGDGTIYTASAATNAVPGSYAVEVQQLALAHKLASKGFATVTDQLGTGTLTITKNNVATAVTIAAADNSLSGIRDAINAAKAGVTATIINDGSSTTPYKLVVTANDTGAANAIKITVSGDSVGTGVDDDGLSQLAYDPAGTLGNGKNLTQTAAAQNALLKVDGVDISKTTNTVTDVIQGVTLSLLKQSALNTPTTLTVSRDAASVKTAVEDFVKAYNNINKTVKDLTGYNATTKQGAILQGDASALSLVSQIRRTLNIPITALSGSYTHLSQIGVSFQSDGTLNLDSAKLQTAIETNFADIAGLFANQGKSNSSLVGYLGATDKTQPGSYAFAVSQVASRGYRNGETTAALADNGAGTFTVPVVVDADNDTFSVKLDGVQTSVITLAQGSYATAAALTAEIQSKINGDSALKAAGVSATISFDSANDRLVFTSDRYGSASAVEITVVDTSTATTLGLTVAAGTAAGVDAAGTINGVAASGSGRILTGATGNAVEGLKLDISGVASGTINYSRGYAWQLDKLAEKLLSSDGPLSSRTDGINRSISDINDRREVLGRRLTEVEKRYRAQFTALDSLVSRLRSTSDFLSRQLAGLQGSG
jgi:flagellar hook-associated protein 2